MAGNQNDPVSSQSPLGEESRKYLESHPRVAEQLQKAEKAYKIFGDYLNLTQARVIIRESGSSTSEANLGATLLRTDQ
jgi:hypothetical protein